MDYQAGELVAYNAIERAVNDECSVCGRWFKENIG